MRSKNGFDKKKVIIIIIRQKISNQTRVQNPETKLAVVATRRANSRIKAKQKQTEHDERTDERGTYKARRVRTIEVDMPTIDRRVRDRRPITVRV